MSQPSREQFQCYACHVDG